mmetsp:Transcript_21755/g.62851  ORF Transcript_21755/g.62851 Transcript_21755/m.62851 type:complete len:106 (+) Transcript_21755:40-357(+)
MQGLYVPTTFPLQRISRRPLLACAMTPYVPEAQHDEEPEGSRRRGRRRSLRKAVRRSGVATGPPEQGPAEQGATLRSCALGAHLEIATDQQPIFKRVRPFQWYST